MAPATRQNEKKTTRDNVRTITGGGEKNPKRQCTTKSAEENYVPDTITSTTEVYSSRDNTINDGGWDRVGGNNDDNEDINKLPTKIQLSKELCRIQDPARYSNGELVCSLNKLIIWTRTKDPDFLKIFNAYGGVNKALDFLTATMNNSNCKGKIRMEFIAMAAHVIVMACCNNNMNKDIVTKIATSAIDWDVTDVLINASEEYNGGDDYFELRAVKNVWVAFVCVTDHKIKISEDQTFSIFDTGIDIITHLKSVDGAIAIATDTIQYVFRTFAHLVKNDIMIKKLFKDRNILSKCLDVFRKNDNTTWDCRIVELTNVVTKFLNHCGQKGFFDQASDYEQLLPFIIVCAKKFPSDIQIQKCTIKLLTDSYNKLNDKTILEKSGAMVVLAEMLALNDANKGLKMKVRSLIHLITAP